MGFQVTTGIQGQALGFFRVNARYTVRGRRGVQLPAELRLSEDERLRIYQLVRDSLEPQYQASIKHGS